jgi:hypothetical protein
MWKIIVFHKELACLLLSGVSLTVLIGIAHDV